MMNKQPLVPIGHSYVSPPNSGGFVQIVDAVEQTINLQAFGVNSYGELQSIQGLKAQEASQEDLIVHGISFVNGTPVNNITGLKDPDGEYEERATTDIILRFSVIYGEGDTIESGIIEKVNIDGTYDICGETKNTTINIDSTI
jgi:hypothetical protein